MPEEHERRALVNESGKQGAGSLGGAKQGRFPLQIFFRPYEEVLRTMQDPWIYR